MLFIFIFIFIYLIFTLLFLHFQNLVSIFDGQNLINSVITLPDNPTKQELLNINETLKQLFAYDLQKLQDYYQANIAFVQKRIDKLH